MAAAGLPGGSPRLSLAAMVVATLLWGGTFVVVRDSLASLSPAALVGARFGIATLVWGAWWVLARARGARTPAEAARAAWVGGLVSAPFTAGGYLFQAIGLTDTSAGSSAFLTSTGTLLAALFAWPLLGQRPGPTLSMGLLFAIAGSALLGIRGDLRLATGEAWTLLGAVIYAVQIVAVSRWAATADPVRLTAVQALGTAVLVLPLAPELPRQLATLAPAVQARLAYLVLAGSLAAPLLQVIAQRSLPAGRIGLLFALEPVFGLAFALTLGGERFVARWWVGAALILAAVVIVEGRALQAPASSRRATG